MRTWLVSAVLVGVAVAAVLVYRNRSEDTPDRPVVDKKGPQYARLTEKEVRTYLEVMPQFNSLFGQIAQAYQNQRAQGTLNDEEFGVWSQQQSAEFLKRFNLSPESFEILRRRVERIVDHIRAEADLKRRNQDLDRRIAEKKRHRGLVKDEETQKLLDADIAKLELERNAEIPALHPEDRKLVNVFWRDLDRVAPKTATPPDRERRGK